jgi:transcription elongation factor Elf1
MSPHSGRSCHALGLTTTTAFLKRTTCPRCNKSLCKIAARSMNPRVTQRIKACPHCGVSLDEPMEGPPREATLDSEVTTRKCVELRAAKVSAALYVAIPAILYAFAAPRGSFSGVIAIGICVVAVAGAAIFINRTPCPRCRHPLGLVANRLGGGGSTSSDRCSACSASVDEPIDRLFLSMKMI